MCSGSRKEAKHRNAGKQNALKYRPKPDNFPHSIKSTEAKENTFFGNMI
jgi:hypothetical protein